MFCFARLPSESCWRVDCLSLVRIFHSAHAFYLLTCVCFLVLEETAIWLQVKSCHRQKSTCVVKSVITEKTVSRSWVGYGVQVTWDLDSLAINMQLKWDGWGAHAGGRSTWKCEDLSSSPSTRVKSWACQYVPVTWHWARRWRRRTDRFQQLAGWPV